MYSGTRVHECRVLPPKSGTILNVMLIAAETAAAAAEAAAATIIGIIATVTKQRILECFYKETNSTYHTEHERVFSEAAEAAKEAEHGDEKSDDDECDGGGMYEGVCRNDRVQQPQQAGVYEPGDAEDDHTETTHLGNDKDNLTK